MIHFATYTARVDALFQLLQSKGQEKYFSESVTLLEHALQTAHFVEKNTDAQEVIIAALLHDIGHLVKNHEYRGHTEFGKHDHDYLGAGYLKSLGFRKDVTYLVANHVKAKRYLVTTDSIYHAYLSEASKQSLILQGGPMWPEEVAQFELEPEFDHMILLRLCDEMANNRGLIVAPLDHYRALLESYLEQSYQLAN